MTQTLWNTGNQSGHVARLQRAQQAWACISNHSSHNFISHLLLPSRDPGALPLSWNGTWMVSAPAIAAHLRSLRPDSSVQLHERKTGAGEVRSLKHRAEDSVSTTCGGGIFRALKCLIMTSDHVCFRFWCFLFHLCCGTCNGRLCYSFKMHRCDMRNVFTAWDTNCLVSVCQYPYEQYTDFVLMQFMGAAC